jgi:hypothetical protein
MREAKEDAIIQAMIIVFIWEAVKRSDKTGNPPFL